MKIQTITLCSSASMYEKLIQIEKDLVKLGFNVLVPVTARKMEEAGDFNIQERKSGCQILRSSIRKLL